MVHGTRLYTSSDIQMVHRKKEAHDWVGSLPGCIQNILKIAFQILINAWESSIGKMLLLYTSHFSLHTYFCRERILITLTVGAVMKIKNLQDVNRKNPMIASEAPEPYISKNTISSGTVYLMYGTLQVLCKMFFSLSLIS